MPGHTYDLIALRTSRLLLVVEAPDPAAARAAFEEGGLDPLQERVTEEILLEIAQREPDGSARPVWKRPPDPDPDPASGAPPAPGPEPS